MLENFLRPKLNVMKWSKTSRIFGYNVMFHAAYRPQEILQKVFLSQMVSLHDAILDLNLCDFFLWGCLKAEVFTYCLRSLDLLKEAIQR